MWSTRTCRGPIAFRTMKRTSMVPGKLNAGGISWFGSPFFLMGFNDRIRGRRRGTSRICRTCTRRRSTLTIIGSTGYDGAWREIRQELATFRVKGPNGIESVTLPLYYTHHGPVVKYDAERNRAWSVKVPNFAGVNYALGLYGLMKVQSLDEFKKAIARQLIPRCELPLHSDVKDIYWVHNGMYRSGTTSSTGSSRCRAGPAKRNGARCALR